MSVNTLTFEQCATVLTSLVKQATGQTPIAITDTGSFVSVAQTAIRNNKDAVINALSEVLARTIFSVRPYESKFTGLEMDTFRWGNMMRKLAIADSDWDEDEAYKYPVLFDSTQNPPTGDGLSVDQWVIKKPNLLQTNFYGSSVFSDHISIMEDQYETAFTSPDEFAQFLSLLMTNMNNRIVMSKENTRRGLVGNAIGSIYAENKAERIVHLLTEYNSLTGESFDNQTIMHPDNFGAFMKWVYSRVANITDLFTENSIKFQTIINNKNILRHTPYEYQKVYLYSPLQRQIESRVLADTYHDNYLKYADVETVTYWQDINSPDSIKVKPAYTATDGTVVTGADQEISNVFGIIFDRDFMGMTSLKQRVIPTPVNGSGIYRNLWYHMQNRVVMDNSEKACILLLD